LRFSTRPRLRRSRTTSSRRCRAKAARFTDFPGGTHVASPEHGFECERRSLTPSSHSDRVARIVLQLRAYATAHPHAADTAQGVLRWWLTGGGITASPEEIEEALATLVAEGTIARRRLPDGSILFVIGGGS
jgi:hypothetical protein